MGIIPDIDQNNKLLLLCNFILLTRHANTWTKKTIYDFPSKPYNKNSSRLNYTVTKCIYKNNRPNKFDAKHYKLSKIKLRS